MAVMTQVGIEFIARNRASAQMNAFNRTLSNMGRQMLMIAGVGGGLYALKRGFDYATRSAMAQEKAERELIAATSASISQFKNYAAEMQKLTIYGDEQILSQMAYAANLGVTTDKLRQATTAAIGLAARFRIDLASAMMLVGRASQGQTQLLTRYGIVIDQNLSDQQKFNELLRIGAESFQLAEEAARDASGTSQQFRNAMSDIAETIGDPLMKALTDFSRWVLNNKSDIQSFIEGQIQGWKDIANAIENVRDISRSMKAREPIKPLSQQDYNMWIAGGPAARPPEPTVSELYVSPRGMQRLAEERARLRWIEAWKKGEHFRMAEEFMAPMEAAPTAPEFKPSAARKRMMGLQQQVDMEMALMGRLREPRQHARMWWQYMQEALKEYGGDMARAEEATEAFRLKLLELEKVERLAKIADSIGESFATAFERMIFEGGRAREVITSMLRDIAMAVVRYQITQPMAVGISEAMRGVFGLKGSVEPVIGERQGGGLIPRTGLYRMHAGEKVEKAGGSSAPVINIYDYPGVKTSEQTEPFYDGEKWIISLESKMADRIGRGAGALAPLINR